MSWSGDGETARKYFHREKGRSVKRTDARGLARNDGPIFVISVHAVNFRRRGSGSRVIASRSTNFRSLAESIRVRSVSTNRHGTGTGTGYPTYAVTARVLLPPFRISKRDQISQPTSLTIHLLFLCFR